MTSFRLRIFLLAFVAYGLGLWMGPHFFPPPLQSPSKPQLTKPAKNSKTGNLDQAQTLPPKAPGFSTADVPNLIEVLENPDRQVREEELKKLGTLHFSSRLDWEKTLNSITDRVDRTSFLRGVISEWAKTNALQALNYLANASLNTRIEIIPAAIAEWAKRDPQAAERWIMDSTIGEVRAQATESLYRAWALTAPELAAAKSLAFSDTSQRDRALSGILQEWSANDLPAVERWTSALPQGAARTMALKAVAEEMAQRNPLEAIRWANAELATPGANSEAIISAVASIAGTEEPAAIMEWLTSLPQTPEVTSAIAGVSSYQTEADPSFYEKGYLKLPAQAREIAAASIANTLGAIQPQKGRQWLQRQPAEMQIMLNEEFVRGWATAQQGEAQKWVDSLPRGPQQEAAARGLINSVPNR